MPPLVLVAVSPLRQHFIDEMDIRGFGHVTQRNYIRDVGRFATILGRSHDTATAENVRRLQIEQSGLNVPAPTMNAIVSASGFSSRRRSTGLTWRASWSGCGMNAGCR